MATTYRSEPGYTLQNYPGAETGWRGNLDDQYIRKWALSLTKSGAPLQPSTATPGPVQTTDAAFGPTQTGQTLVLTTETPGYDFRMLFKIRHADSETPGTAEIRIYNLKTETANNVINEFDRVILQAGYVHGHYGVIFEGTIKQYKRGRESATDSYLDIFAADGDAAWNYKFLSKTLDPGNTAADRQKALADAFSEAGTKKGEIVAPFGGTIPSPRSAVVWGALTDEVREYNRTNGTTWSIQNGTMQSMPANGYKRGDIVVINSGTGMIGEPEVTQDGIYITTLLNPNYWVKGRVQVDNKTLNQSFLPGGQPIQGGVESLIQYPQPNAQGRYFASIARDGIYCILVIDHEGDTRGLRWYSHLICLNVNPSQPFDKSLTAGGWTP